MKTQKVILWIAGVLIVASAALLFYSSRHQPAAPPPPPTAATAPAPPPAPPAPPPIEHPVPAPSASQPPLPSLRASDSLLRRALDSLVGSRAARGLFKPDMLVRHIVVTIDNLPRKHAAVELRPIRDVPGSFMAQGTDQDSTLDPANYKRYDPYVQALQHVDVKQFASWYLRLYPLFQQAYQDLGYPHGYFNDRLVQVIDDLLATPTVRGPIKLVRPNVNYLYADPKLEQLSYGQKLLLRMGPKNAAIVKAKLRQLRAVIVEQHAGGASAGAAAGAATGPAAAGAAASQPATTSPAAAPAAGATSPPASAKAPARAQP